MSQASKFDQFIYGKFVGNENGYRVVSYSENLNNISSDADNFIEVYQCFYSQYFQDKSPDKIELFSIFSNLIMDSNSNCWINWQDLSKVLYKDDIK
ncbi:hypothetical protein [Okeania sp. SIO1I7]|uniref:hypothetical protein n=1 Tax=Okeania sp. SIO1I7 TaxID=2607772 RepID=UPI0013F7118B|nr:hypothetical protein [Okeania sp. SIO1I7]NET24608.1 hypothetical protein [Okeania sp. SIO1I7]